MIYEEFKTILNSSFLNIADGNGVVWASKQMKDPLEERVAGFDFIHRLFELGKDNDIKFYFLGAKPGIAEKAKENLENTHEYIKIVGAHDGYFSADDENQIIEEINSKNPDVLLVALGSPKQEKFIYKYKDKLNCKIAIGVGGCFDVISGTVKRAPKIFIKLKLEWLYRGLTDLKRIKRVVDFIIEQANEVQDPQFRKYKKFSINSKLFLFLTSLLHSLLHPVSCIIIATAT